MKLAASLLLVAGALSVAGCSAPADRPAALIPPAQPGRQITTVEAPATHTSGPPRLPTPPPLDETEPTAPARSLAPARLVARRFFARYVRFLYARIPSVRLADVDERLGAELRAGEAMVTPAERDAKPRIARVSVAPAGPPLSVIATATVVAQEESYQLTATLEPRAGSWMVVAIDG